MMKDANRHISLKSTDWSPKEELFYSERMARKMKKKKVMFLGSYMTDANK